MSSDTGKYYWVDCISLGYILTLNKTYKQLTREHRIFSPFAVIHFIQSLGVDSLALLSSILSQYSRGLSLMAPLDGHP